MTTEMAKIELSKDLIEPIVRAQLQASIMSALGRSEELICQVVQTVMNTKVDEDGRNSHYSSARPMITWMAEKAIKEAAAEAIKEWFATNKEQIKKHLLVAIQKNAKGLAESFVLGIGTAAEASYKHNITVTLTNGK